MALPNVRLRILDGGLGQTAGVNPKAQVKIGVCSDGVPGTLYAFGDQRVLQATLGQGPLVESCAQALNVAGAPIYALPITPSVAGTAGSIAHTGSGAGALSVTFAPRVPIAIKIGTGGINGTATFAVSVNGSAYSTPVATIAGAFPYAVPGTLTTVTLAAGQTWVSGDIYTVNTDGTVVLTGTGPAASNVTQVSSPLDAYAVTVAITLSGSPGTGQFTWSVDGGGSTSPTTLIPSGGKYVVRDTGLVLAFSGAFVASDGYTFSTTAAGFSTGDVTAALQALLLTPQDFRWVHIVGAAATSSGAAGVAGAADAQMSAAEAAFRYVFAIVECPQESDSTIAAAFASFASLRVAVVAGDEALRSPITGRVQRRNLAWSLTARLGAIEPAQSAAAVGDGPLKNVASLYRDEALTPALNDLRFVTGRTFPGGVPGFYVTRANTMAPVGSDFDRIERRRVMDIACVEARAAELPYLNGTMRVDDQGHILEADAKAFEAKVRARIKAALTGQISDVRVTVNRETNVLSTNSLPVLISIRPLFTAEFIDTTIAFENPAITAAAA